MSEKVKINKVETPIDQRETFVSLSKNFSEGSLSVAEKLKVLYALQQTDNEIDKIFALRGALPQEVEAVEAELASLKGKIEANKEIIAGFEANIDKNKQDIVELDEEINKYHEQLGNVSNSREYDSINKELENLGLLRDIAEKHINDARFAISEKKDAIDVINDRIAIREEDLAAKKAELERGLTKIRPQCSQITSLFPEAISTSFCGVMALKHPPQDSSYTGTTAK